MNDESGSKSFYSIKEEEKDKRIDTFLTSLVKDLTRSKGQSLIKEGHIKVNELNVKASYRLKTGDRISIFIPPPEPSDLTPEPVEFSLIHEDSSLIVLNKPPGIVIHPAPGHSGGTLVHGLLYHCEDLSGIGGVLRPGIVHRLDKDTSGLMVVAKNNYVHSFLSAQFKEGKINKKYSAIVHGILPDEKGKIDLPISRHPKRRKEMAVNGTKGGKKALTLWKKNGTLGDKFTILSITLKTGRTHQIRVHLSHEGHPIVGDPVYGYRKSWWQNHCPQAMALVPKIKRQMLHSELLGFIHPESEKYCEFKSPIPDDMEYVINSLKVIFDSKKE